MERVASRRRMNLHGFSYLVRDLMKEDGDCGGGTDGGRRVERCRHGQAIRDVVCEVGTVGTNTMLGLIGRCGHAVIVPTRAALCTQPHALR